jgi:hypothetical protein
MTEKPPAISTGSRAHTPDLDWSQVRETVLMLQLAVGQIEAAMKDGSNSVEVLTDAFTGMAGYLAMMSGAARHLPDVAEVAEIKSTLTANTEHLTGMVRRSIVAFQFYDKLVQRLTHVMHSLNALSDLVADQRRLYNPGEWVAMQQKIRSRYTTRDEVAMFEAVINGMSVDEALQRFMEEKRDQDDVELF